MPNQINSTNTPKKYDASDMHDLASLAESDMNWMCTAISHIRKEVMKLNKLAESGKEDRHRNHAKGAEAYKAEWEKTKGGEV